MSTASLSPARKILPILLWTAIGAAAVFALFTLAVARGESVNALWLVTAAVCVYLIGYRFYALVHRAKAVAARRQSPDAGASPQRRARLCADRQICAVRPSFRGHRRRRPAGRTRARRANGLSARRAVADDRRRLRRRGAGHARPVHFDAPRRPLARRSRQDRDGRGRGVRRHVRHSRDHGHSARRARPRRHQGAGRQSLGRLHRFRDIADRGFHGRLWALSAPRPYLRDVADRLRAADRQPRAGAQCRAKRDSGAAVHLQGRDAGLHADRLWLRRLGAAGVAAAGAARLSLDLPQDRHDHLAGHRHFHRLAAI